MAMYSARASFFPAAVMGTFILHACALTTSAASSSTPTAHGGGGAAAAGISTSGKGKGKGGGFVSIRSASTGECLDTTQAGHLLVDLYDCVSGWAVHRTTIYKCDGR